MRFYRFVHTHVQEKASRENLKQTKVFRSIRQAWASRKRSVAYCFFCCFCVFSVVCNLQHRWIDNTFWNAQSANDKSTISTVVYYYYFFALIRKQMIYVPKSVITHQQQEIPWKHIRKEEKNDAKTIKDKRGNPERLYLLLNKKITHAFPE